MTETPLLRIDGPALVFGGPYGNLQATAAVLDEAARLGIPPSHVICTGDLVAYCGDPATTIDLVRHAGIHVVMGNCDEQLAQNGDDCGCGFPAGSACERASSDWFAFADANVGREARAWLAELPRRIDLVIGGRRLAVVHGSVSRINQFVFASSAAAIKRCELDLAGATASSPAIAACRSASRSTESSGTMPASSACRRTTARPASGSACSCPPRAACASSIARSPTITPPRPPPWRAPASRPTTARRSRPASGRPATCCPIASCVKAASRSSLARPCGWSLMNLCAGAQARGCNSCGRRPSAAMPRRSIRRNSTTRCAPPRASRARASPCGGSRRSGSTPARSATSRAATATSSSSPRNDRLVYLTLADVRPFLDEIERDRLGTREIGFTGGEPFMNPHLFEMLEECLRRGFRTLVLTNAMRPMQRHKAKLLDLHRRHGSDLVIRVSLDHYTAERHEDERGVGSFAPTRDGLVWLARHGFNPAVAGRTMWGEDEAAERDGFARLFVEHAIPVDAHDPGALVLFPEMDAAADVPEITTACWDILGKSPEQVMCASSRMVVRRNGAERAAVLSCTLIPYDPAFEMGPTLADAAHAVPLNHPHCAKFCVLGGASCSRAVDSQVASAAVAAE